MSEALAFCNVRELIRKCVVTTCGQAWGVLLKLLIGPGPHKLYEFEDVLPRLPLPLLEKTCTKYEGIKMLQFYCPFLST